MKKCILAAVALAALVLGGCSPKQKIVTADDVLVKSSHQEKPLGMMPKAVVYKTNGNYADHVVVTLNDDLKTLAYFPGPGDVSQAYSSPVALQDGFLLDRQGGIGDNTRFLTWTYDEYSRLPSVPNPAEIMAHIIPEARVTQVVVLPMTLQKALDDIPAVEAELNAIK